MREYIRQRKGYLPYIGMAVLVLAVVQVAVVVLMTLEWVPVPLARTLSTVAWLGMWGWGVVTYARRKNRAVPEREEASAQERAPALVPQQEHSASVSR